MKKVLYTILVFFIVTSCVPDSDNKNVANDYLKTINKDITNSDIDIIISKISAEFENQNLPSINVLFDYEALLSRGLIKSNKNLSKLGNVTKGVDALINENPMLEKIQQSFTYYDFIKEYQDTEGYTVIVFRGYGLGGVNYHEYVLGNISGETKIIDIYLVLNGSYISVTLMDFMSDLFEIDPNINNGLDYSTIMKASNDYIIEGDFEAAYLEFQKIPEELRNETQLLAFFEIQTLLNYDEELYLIKIEEYREKYPETVASVDLFSLDYYFLKERYDDVLVSLNRLKKNYPNDNVIDFLIGSTYSYKGECNKAVKHCKKSIEGNKSMLEFQDGLMAIYFECDMKEEGFNLASDLIREDYFNYEDINYYLSTIYDDFETWPSYIKWSEIEKQ